MSKRVQTLRSGMLSIKALLAYGWVSEPFGWGLRGPHWKLERIHDREATVQRLFPFVLIFITIYYQSGPSTWKLVPVLGSLGLLKGPMSFCQLQPRGLHNQNPGKVFTRRAMCSGLCWEKRPQTGDMQTMLLDLPIIFLKISEMVISLGAGDTHTHKSKKKKEKSAWAI